MKLFVISILFLLSQFTFAQSSVLPIDERGVHTFLEVHQASADNPELPGSVQRFFRNNSKYLKLNFSKGDTLFSGNGKFILSKGTAGIGRPAAEANFNIYVELRGQKYRLILTDFVVTPYERDRYANFVPSTVKYRLEDKPGKLNKGEWERNMKSIIAESEKLSGKLKAIITTRYGVEAASPKKPAKVSTKNW